MRVVPIARNPQTPRNSSSRVNTLVGSPASARSSAYSFLDSATGSPLTHTWRLIGSSSSDPIRSRPVPGRRRRPPQQRPYPRAQLVVREGLHHVVVATAAEAAQPVELAHAPGQHEQRQVRIQAAGDAIGVADVREQLETIAVGQAEVDDRQVGEGALEQTPGVGHALGFEHVEAVGRQVVREERAGGAVVFDDEDGGGVMVHAPKSLEAPRIHPSGAENSRRRPSAEIAEPASPRRGNRPRYAREACRADAGAVSGTVNHTVLPWRPRWSTPHSADEHVDDLQPATARVGGLGRAHLGRAARSVGRLDADVPPVRVIVSSKPLSVCRMQFVASSETISSTASIVSAETPRSTLVANRRAAGTDSGSWGKVRAVLHGFTFSVSASPIESMTRRRIGETSRSSISCTAVDHRTHSAIAELSANRSPLNSMTNLPG